MIVVHSFKSLQETFKARASEWALAAMMISLAVVFVLNDSMFYRQSFDGLRTILNSQLGWASILAVVGTTRLTVLIINGAYWRTPHFRSLTAFLSAGVWFLFCMGFVRNGSVMTAIMPWIFLLDAYNAKSTGHEAGKSEYFQRYAKNSKGRNDAGMVVGAQR